MIELFVNANLTVKQLVFKILKNRGPFTNRELAAECRKMGKVTTSEYTVRDATRQLRDMGLVVRANGGWAIHNWQQIGENQNDTK